VYDDLDFGRSLSWQDLLIVSTHSMGLHLCADGPLCGKFHHRGPRFWFDGSPIGGERGVYVLEEGEYHWQVDTKARAIVLEQSSH